MSCALENCAGEAGLLLKVKLNGMTAHLQPSMLFVTS